MRLKRTTQVNLGYVVPKYLNSASFSKVLWALISSALLNWT